MLLPSPSCSLNASGSFFEETRRGIAVRVRVSPGSHRDQIDGLVAGSGGRIHLKVAVRAAADRGQANTAVVALLAREWKFPKSHLTIVAGSAHRNKVIGIAGESGAVADGLASWASRHLAG